MRGLMLVLALAGVVACEAEEDTAAAEAAIRAQADALVAAMLAKDAAGAAAIFAPDAAMYPPNSPAVVGTAAITAWGEMMFARLTMLSAQLTLDEVQIADDWAVSRGHWGMTVAVGTDTVSDTTAWMMTWRRGDDGRWRIARDIWNSIRPAM